MNTETGRTYRPLIVLVVVAVLAASVVWFVTRDGDTAPAPANASSRSLHSDVDGAQELMPQRPPSDGVELPQGSDGSDGYPVGFPHTDLGAAAVQVEVARAQSGFDYAQAAKVAAVYAAPEDRGAFVERSRTGVELARKAAGLSADGAVKIPASYVVTPIAFTVEKLDTDFYAVNVLCSVSVTDLDGHVTNTLFNGTQLVGWVEGDWRLIAGSSDDKRELLDAGQPDAAAPGTTKFDREGWTLIAGASQ